MQIVITIFGMVQTGPNEFGLASGQDPEQEPTYWDVLVRRYHDDTDEVDFLEEVEDLTTYEEASQKAQEFLEKYPNAIIEDDQ